MSLTHQCSFIGEGNGNPLQYSCLENPMDRGAWWTAVHGVTKSQTRLSDFTFTFHFHALEREMAAHSSVLAWRIPGTGEPGGLPSMGSYRVKHNWSDLAAAAALYISCDLLNTMLKVKIRMAVWVQNDYKYISCLPLWLHIWLGGVAHCHCLASQEYSTAYH